jgi:hypothetical protein
LCSRVVGQTGCSVQELTGLGHVEQKGDPGRALTAPVRPQRRRRQQVLADHPFQEAADDAYEVVEAAGPGSRSGSKEAIEKDRIELVDVLEAVSLGKGDQQVEFFSSVWNLRPSARLWAR